MKRWLIALLIYIAIQGGVLSLTAGCHWMIRYFPSLLVGFCAMIVGLAVVGSMMIPKELITPFIADEDEDIDVYLINGQIDRKDK